MICFPSSELIPNKKAIVGLLSGLVLAGVTAQASLIQLNNPAALGTASVLSWGGPFWTMVPNNTAFSSGGITVQASEGGGGPLWQNVQGNFNDDSGFYWDGNFTPGESVLYNGATAFNTNPGPISLHFTSPVLGAGIHVEQNWSAGAGFVGTISAFDVSNGLLGSYSFNGIAGQSADGTAAFAGFLSSSLNISTITISTESNDFAIGALSINVSDEGSTAALLGSAVAGLWLLRKRK